MTAMLISGAVFAADPPATASTENASTPAKTTVTPHNHMRDAKGMGTGDMHGSSATTTAPSAETGKDASTKSNEAENQEKQVKKGVKPHNHPRDAKGA